MKATTAQFYLVLVALAAALPAAEVFAGNADAQPVAYAEDSAVTAKIKAKLAADSAGSLVRISVETAANGAVHLSGSAKSQADADRAVSIARSTEGVTAVNSQITITE
jgi:hyperosmotically inducible protein